MTKSKIDRIRALLKGIETGDPASVDVIHPTTYIQHNPQTQEGRDGLAALFKRLSTTNPRVNIVRAFEDGAFVFAHTEYDFATRRIGFEVFRFEDDFAVEHWDNIQAREGPNMSGRSMVDGPAEVTDLQSTETNRRIASEFVETVLVAGQIDKAPNYVNADLIQHNAHTADGLTAWCNVLRANTSGTPTIRYNRLHRVLAQGNFVLAVSEGEFRSQHAAIYNLFRLSNGQIAETWDTIEAVAPRAEWKNDNGKF